MLFLGWLVQREDEASDELKGPTNGGGAVAGRALVGLVKRPSQGRKTRQPGGAWIWRSGRLDESLMEEAGEMVLVGAS